MQRKGGEDNGNSAYSLNAGCIAAEVPAAAAAACCSLSASWKCAALLAVG